MEKIAIVILNFNGEKHLRRFLPAVVSNSRPAKVIVADNCSTDGSLSYVRSAHPDVGIIELDRNYGYSGGYDRALRMVDAEIFCLLNSDVEVTQGWLDPILELFRSSDEIAAVQPKILSWHDRDTFEYAGAGGGYIDKYGFPFCRGRVFWSFEKDHGQYDDVTRIFWASGACLFIRSEDFMAADGLDTDFFAHMEEIDLCWRLWGMGKKVMYTGKSTVYHVGGGTLDKSNPRKTYLNFRNGMSLLYKNSASDKYRGRMLMRWIFDLAAVLRFLVVFQWAHAWAVLRAHFDFFSSMPVQRKKRKASQSLMRIPDVPTIYPKSLIYAYFIKGRRDYPALAGSEKLEGQ